MSKPAEETVDGVAIAYDEAVFGGYPFAFVFEGRAFVSPYRLPLGKAAKDEDRHAFIRKVLTQMRMMLGRET